MNIQKFRLLEPDKMSYKLECEICGTVQSRMYCKNGISGTPLMLFACDKCGPELMKA